MEILRTKPEPEKALHFQDVLKSATTLVKTQTSISVSVFTFCRFSTLISGAAAILTSEETTNVMRIPDSHFQQ